MMKKNRIGNLLSRPESHEAEEGPYESAHESGGWQGPLKQFVGDHPTVGLTLAFSLGVFIGWFVKRK